MTEAFLSNLDNLLSEFYSTSSDNARKAQIGQYVHLLDTQRCYVVSLATLSSCLLPAYLFCFPHHFKYLLIVCLLLVYSFLCVSLLSEQDLQRLRNAENSWQYCIQLLQQSQSQYSQWWALSTLEVCETSYIV